ncbi:MAG: GDP/UDP-N,N'-diacetylbacillosamine 2-epimerase (hydrolyzing) [Oleiphilaceae bacterium]|jgi:GDP/UDP-N,N'-diacetylbacillosamine 2-epimerase (hydrolysing)
MIRKVCVVTGTRAEYGLLKPIMEKITNSVYLELQLVVTTMHLSEEFGLTYKQIEKDGFSIDEKIENLLAIDSKTAMAKSSGLAIILMSDVLTRLRPDIVLLLGDRYETHAVATTAMLMNVPIAHVHGGELTEGAVDEQIRHSITKMAYLHFTSTEEYRNRVIQLGEDPKRVFCTGAPGIDNIFKMSLQDEETLEQQLKWEINSPTALFTFHSETLSTFDMKVQIERILQAIEVSGINVLFTYANADDGGRAINCAIEKFVDKNKKKYCVVKSLGQVKYLSAMKHVSLVIGNTSSGIIEAASFHKPVVNIGHRQQGRLQSGNVINCNIENIPNAITKALNDNFSHQCKKTINLYGKGNAAEQIVEQLELQQFDCVKRFYDL